MLALQSGSFTAETMFGRVADVALASFNIANALALIGAVFYVVTLLMRTIVPLRIFGIFGDMSFIAYGVLAHSVTTVLL